MLHASKYNIGIRVPGSDNVIVVNGISGSIDVIDAAVARHLVPGESTAQQMLLSGLPSKSLNYLSSRGYLTSQDDDAETRSARDLALRLEQREARTPPLFYLMTTYDCQLRCTYCFEHETRSRFRREGRTERAITPQLISAAFAAMDQIRPNAAAKACTLYGGEPLLVDNKEQVACVVAEGAQRGYRLMAATNGFDLQHYRDLLGPDGIAGLHVPLDGTRFTHDKLRIGKHRAPTFDRIIENLRDALSRGVRIRVRINADREVLDGLEEIADVFEGIGFLRSPLFSCYVKAIFATRAGKPQKQGAIADAEVAQRLASSPRLAQIFSGYPVIHDRIDALFADQPSDAIRSGHCGAPTGQILIFDPTGQIFPCNNIVGEIRHQIGTYYPTLRWNNDVRRTWMTRTVSRMPEVQTCKYAFFCGGGCLYDAQVQHGSIQDKSCDCGDFAKQFEGLVLANYFRIFRVPALAESDDLWPV